MPVVLELSRRVPHTKRLHFKGEADPAYQIGGWKQSLQGAPEDLAALRGQFGSLDPFSHRIRVVRKWKTYRTGEWVRQLSSDVLREWLAALDRRERRIRRDLLRIDASTPVPGRALRGARLAQGLDIARREREAIRREIGARS